MTNRRRWQRPACLAALVLAVATLPACGAGGSAATEQLSSCPKTLDVAKAKDEGRVVVYTTTPETQEDRMVKAFNQKYPDVHVTVVRGAGELPERVAAESKSGSDGADVFTFSDPAWFSANKDQVIELGGKSVDAWPKNYWQEDRKAALSSVSPFGMIVWNTKKFPRGFKAWTDLLAPSVKGQLGTRSDMTAAYAGYLDFLQKQEGSDYLSRLASQKPKFYPSVVPMAQAVASGEIGVANLSVPAVVSGLKADGAPIEAVVPSPGYGIAFASGVLKNAHRPYAACLYLDFVLSPDGQAAYNGDGLGASALPGIEGALPIEGLSIFDSAKYTPAALAQWQKTFEKTFQ